MRIRRRAKVRPKIILTFVVGRCIRFEYDRPTQSLEFEAAELKIMMIIVVVVVLGVCMCVECDHEGSGDLTREKDWRKISRG